MSEPGPLRRMAEPIIRDAVGLVGCGTLLHGLYQISAVAAEIAGGAVLVAGCLLWARYRG